MKALRSAHFTNALKKERERLVNKAYAIAEKMRPLLDQEKIINLQIAGIDEQLGSSLDFAPPGLQSTEGEAA